MYHLAVQLRGVRLASGLASGIIDPQDHFPSRLKAHVGIVVGSSSLDHNRTTTENELVESEEILKTHSNKIKKLVVKKQSNDIDDDMPVHGHAALTEYEMSNQEADREPDHQNRGVNRSTPFWGYIFDSSFRIALADDQARRPNHYSLRIDLFPLPTKLFGSVKKIGSVICSLSSLERSMELTSWRIVEPATKHSPFSNETVKLLLSLTAKGFGREDEIAQSAEALREHELLTQAEASSSLALEQLDSEFGSMLDDLNIGELEARSRLLALSNPQKLTLMTQHDKLEREQVTGNRMADTPQAWIQRLRQFSPSVDVCDADYPGEFRSKIDSSTEEDDSFHESGDSEVELLYDILISLEIVLRTKPLPWILSFASMEGIKQLACIFHELTTCQPTTPRDVRCIEASVKCTRALLHTPEVFQQLIDQSQLLEALCFAIDFPADSSIDHQKLILETCITASCKTRSGGHRQIISGFSEHAKRKQGKRRFQQLVERLATGLDTKQPDFVHPDWSVCALYLRLIKSLINTPNDLYLRVTIRSEFAELGLPHVLKSFRAICNRATWCEGEERNEMTELIDNLDEAEEQDRKALSDLFRDVSVDLNDPFDIFHGLHDQCVRHGLESTMLEILRHLLILPANKDVGIEAWMLHAQITKQISSRVVGLDRGTTEHTSQEIDIGSRLIDINALLTTADNDRSLITPLRAHIQELNTRIDAMQREISALEDERAKDERSMQP